MLWYSLLLVLGCWLYENLRELGVFGTCSCVSFGCWLWVPVLTAGSRTQGQETGRLCSPACHCCVGQDNSSVLFGSSLFSSIIRGKKINVSDDS